MRCCCKFLFKKVKNDFFEKSARLAIYQLQFKMELVSAGPD
jgi:hypothetical protein